MKIDGKPYRSVWRAVDGTGIEILDQTKLPHALEVLRLDSAVLVAVLALISTLPGPGAV